MTRIPGVACYTCGVPAAHEKHHVIPRAAGGTQVVPLCIACHDIAQRIPGDDWRVVEWMLQEQAREPAPRWALLLLLKVISAGSLRKREDVEALGERVQSDEEDESSGR